MEKKKGYRDILEKISSPMIFFYYWEGDMEAAEVALTTDGVF